MIKLLNGFMMIIRKINTVSFGEISRDIGMKNTDILEKEDDDFDLSEITIPEEYQFIEDWVNNDIDDENGNKVDNIGAIFLTGKAGTGKSTAIKYLKHKFQKSVVIAPTAIAAMNVKGSTIHSFFGFPPSIIDPSEVTKVNEHKVPVIQNLDLLIVDEVSMITSAMVDCMDKAIRLAKNSSIPFGGIKMLFVGDLFQLPPILEDEEIEKYFSGVNERYDSELFFSADVFKKEHGNCNMYPLELKEVKRQDANASTDNAKFIEVLNAVRINNTEHIFSGLEFLNEKCLKEKNLSEKLTEGTIALVPTKAVARSINKEEINKIKSPCRMYKGHLMKGITSEMIKQFQAPDELELKVGAQVVFVTNNKPKWFNGELGIVTDMTDDVIKVRVLKTGNEFDVKRASFGKYTYKYDKNTQKLSRQYINAFIQFPLALGWAITIHKSQGMTLENAIVDIRGNAFAEGQTYVALSRVRSINGLQLRSPLEYSDIKVRDQVLKAYNKLFPESYSY